MDTKPFVLIVFTLMVLIALALWQFYSLAWADIGVSSSLNRNPSVALSAEAVAA